MYMNSKERIQKQERVIGCRPKAKNVRAEN